MTSKLKDGWRTIMPEHMAGKSSTCFCFFPKVKSLRSYKGRSPVYLNVYDLTPMNGYLYWAGFGIFHTGLEVHEVEYGFGAHEFPTSGVFEVEPRQCPGFKFRKSIFIGTTYLDPTEVREFMEQLSVKYNGDSYNLIENNCNHFCEDICRRLTGKQIPKWVNRLARIGSLCNCILPDAIKETTVGPPGTDIQVCESEKTRLRSPVNCISPLSMYQEQEVSLSSMFLHSHLNSCLSPPHQRGLQQRGKVK
ncbi:cysteine protease [Lithospermum erythrorhizon]|uniref:Cysteine protease n=1 Tax=Lithospermum erythrorhizon TaxID=34254 RepID=A0AAV3PR98_LITER